jgi:hypothetical protein
MAKLPVMIEGNRQEVPGFLSGGDPGAPFLFFLPRWGSGGVAAIIAHHINSVSRRQMPIGFF